MDNQKRRTAMIGLFFVILIILGDLVSGFLGISSPVTTPYSINSVTTKTFGPGTTFHNLSHTQIYCTGVTAGPITSRRTSNPVFLIFGLYSIQDVNVTGQIVQVDFEIGQSAPTTVFAAGECATSTAGVIYSLFFGVTGTYFSASVAANDIVVPGGVYYVWISIQPINTDVRIVVSQSAARPSLSLQEQV